MLSYTTLILSPHDCTSLHLLLHMYPPLLLPSSSPPPPLLLPSSSPPPPLLLPSSSPPPPLLLPSSSPPPPLLLPSSSPPPPLLLPSSYPPPPLLLPSSPPPPLPSVLSLLQVTSEHISSADGRSALFTALLQQAASLDQLIALECLLETWAEDSRSGSLGVIKRTPHKVLRFAYQLCACMPRQ